MRLASLLLCASLASPCAYASVAATPASDAATLDTPFTLKSDTQIPGKVLKAGGYTLVIKDHLTDRAIIEVRKDDGKLESTFLGVFHSGMQSNGNGPIAIPIEKGPQAMRGFRFPGGGTIEFVYPKAEAAKLATKSPEQVLAIDPASDNLKGNGNNLSNEDARIVTLWSLQATKVATGQAGIAAKKYVGEPNGGGNSVVASAAAVPAPRPVTSNAVVAPAPRPQPVSVRQAPPPPATQVASAPRRPKLAALPHTGSSMPLMLLAVLASFSAALVTRFTRVAVAVRNER